MKKYGTIKGSFILFLMAAFAVIAEGRSVHSNSDNPWSAMSDTPRQPYPHMTRNNTIHDVVHHPAFQGFGRFILPLDRGGFDPQMPLSRVEKLLPYHTHVNPDKAVETINRMIEAAEAGNRLFYPLYTGERERRDATRENAGLFFFRGKPGAPFAVVCPGGGFSYVGSIHEGFPYALELQEKGYNAFVLQYRTGNGKAACEDLAAAIDLIFRKAAALSVGTGSYSVWGSSAGARMAAVMGSHGPAAFGYTTVPKPAAVIMAYTGYSDYTRNDPPTFIVQGGQDWIASPSVSARRARAMNKAGIDVEYLVYNNLGHGFGPGTGTEAEGWISRAIRFWESHMNN